MWREIYNNDEIISEIFSEEGVTGVNYRLKERREKNGKK